MAWADGSDLSRNLTVKITNTITDLRNPQVKVPNPQIQVQVSNSQV